MRWRSIRPWVPRWCWCWVAVWAMTAAPSALAQPGGAPRDELRSGSVASPLGGARVVVAPRVVTSIIREVKLPAEETGRLVKLQVKLGEQVQAEQLVGQIDDRQAQFDRVTAEIERDAAQARADDDIEVRYARAAYELEDAELQQDLEINRKKPGTIPATDIRKQQLEKVRAQLQIERSELDLRVSKLTADKHQAAVAKADETIRRCKLVAPFAGQVVELLRQQDEWVNAGDSVVRIVQLDRLYVDANINAAEHSPAEIAQKSVVLEVELERGKVVQFSGQVVYVDPTVRSDGTLRIKAEVENRAEHGQWVLLPGMDGRMVIKL